MPQPNNSSPYPNYPNQGQPPFGSGFPNQQPTPYPPNPGYPAQSGYPSQAPYPGSTPYPQQSAVFPQLPSSANSYPSQHGGAYPPPSQPGFQSNYPPAQSSAMPSYPPQSGIQSNYPPSQSTAMPGYSPMYPTPSSTNNVYPSQAQYPPQSNHSIAPPQAYPSLQSSGSSQHAAVKNVAACFSEMRGHKPETRSKVCLYKDLLGIIWIFLCVEFANSSNKAVDNGLFLADFNVDWLSCYVN